jgi:putative transcriptional regulator
MPQLGDPNFSKSVVLMLEHSENGSMGVVINKAGPINLGELGKTQGIEINPMRASEPIYIGGPVESERGFVLHDREDIEEKHELLKGLYLSLTMQSLEPLLRDPNGHLRFCLGYAGWGPKQLEHEMSEGSWIFTEVQPRTALSSPHNELWDTVVRSMGFDPGSLVISKGLN